MSASVMTAFAVYTANDVEFYLKVVDASAGTVSADGTTITFKDAAEAKGAKLTVQEFIKADAANPSVQQAGSTFSVSNKAIKLDSPVSYTESIGDEQTYDINGKSVTTDLFVSCFAYANKRGTFFSGNQDVSWGHSDNYTWDYDGVDQLSIIWSYDPNDPNHDDSKETAHFASTESDKYPFTQFGATLGDLADGKYTIDIIDEWTHGELGVQNGTFMNVDGKNKIYITNHPGINIVVGDASAETTTEPTTEKTEPTTEKTEPTSEQNPSTAFDPAKATEWTWYMETVYYDPASDPDGMGVDIPVYVTKDPGTYGYEFTPLFNGKTADEVGFEVLEATQPAGSYKFGTFTYNDKNGHVGAASKVIDEATKKALDTVLKDGSVAVNIAILPKNVKEGEVYELTFKDLVVGNAADVKSTPATVAGKLIIGKEGTVPVEPTTEKTEPSTAPTDEEPTTGENPTTPQQSGDYLYGDVNENGKVELVDIVKLNRFLTGIDTELSAVATVNANCYRDAKESDADTTTKNLSAKDSVEILRYLIGLVKNLPTQG
jgi:hypothetical protein